MAPRAFTSSQSLECRPMLVSDLDRVMEAEIEIYPFPWTRANFAGSLQAGHEGWFVEPSCEAQRRECPLVGYAMLMWAVDEVHLLNLSIAAPWQGRGLGRWLLEWLCTRSESRGAVSMLLEVRPSNPKALQLYESAAFARIGLRGAYYPAANGHREDAIVMRRVLGK